MNMKYVSRFSILYNTILWMSIIYVNIISHLYFNQFYQTMVDEIDFHYYNQIRQKEALPWEINR